LTTYASNLATFLRANLPTAALDDVIGGLSIVPHSDTPVRQTSLPYQDTGIPVTEWTEIPDSYKPTLRVQYQGLDTTYTADTIYGKRLSITYDTAEAVLGASLGVISATWIAQVNRSDAIADSLGRTTTLLHHQVGIAGFNSASYVDLPGNLVSVVSQAGDGAREDAVFFSTAMHGSIFESTAVQQTAGVSAVSTVKLIDLAAANNQPIYNATASNYTGAVKPNLVSCTARLSAFQGAVTAGHRLILPKRCDLTEGTWSGAGYFDILINANDASIGAIIGGGLAGGFSTQTQPAYQFSPNVLDNSASPLLTYQQWSGAAFGEPIDMTKGHYRWTNWSSRPWVSAGSAINCSTTPSPCTKG